MLLNFPCISNVGQSCTRRERLMRIYILGKTWDRAQCFCASSLKPYYFCHSITMEAFIPVRYKTATIHQIEHTPGSHTPGSPHDRKITLFKVSKQKTLNTPICTVLS